VQSFGGFGAKYSGYGVLTYFGYTQAHEDDAERAVRAGLELVSAVGALKTHAALQTRVGIATVLVVVGDLIGSGASQEQAIKARRRTLAARLQSVAEADSVVIAESTRKLIGNLFALPCLESTRAQRHSRAGTGVAPRRNAIERRSWAGNDNQSPGPRTRQAWLSGEQSIHHGGAQ